MVDALRDRLLTLRLERVALSARWFSGRAQRLRAVTRPRAWSAPPGSGCGRWPATPRSGRPPPAPAARAASWASTSRSRWVSRSSLASSSRRSADRAWCSSTSCRRRAAGMISRPASRSRTARSRVGNGALFGTHPAAPAASAPPTRAWSEVPDRISTRQPAATSGSTRASAVDPPPGRVPAQVEVEQHQPGRQLRGGGQHRVVAAGPAAVRGQPLRAQAEHERRADQLVVVHHERRSASRPLGVQR